MNCHNEYRRDINNNINLFFKGEPLEKRINGRMSFYDSLNSLANKHYILEERNFSGRMKIKNCSALIYGKQIIERLSCESYASDYRCSLDDDFYSVVGNELFGKKHIINDPEVLIIHLKQVSEILRKSKLIVNLDGLIKPVSEKITTQKLFHGMLSAFWNNVVWEDIFPSSPELAKTIHENRSVILEMLNENRLETKTEDFSGDFFELTGISNRDDSFNLSFFEFYVTSWLRNFGIIQMDETRESEVFSIDDYGLAVIKSIY